MIIAAKIDCSKIDKARLFEGKTGAKYLDVILMTNKDGRQTSKFGKEYDGLVRQSVTKEERANGVNGEILGDFRIIAQDKPTSNDGGPAF